MAEEMTDGEKVRALATWSRQYKNGLKSLIAAGGDPEQIEELVTAAEQELEAQEKDRRKRARTKRTVRKF